MNSQNNYIMLADTNAFNNYYNNIDNNFERNQDKNISNNAKELIKNFKNQYLTNNSINQRIFTKGNKSRFSKLFKSYTA